MDWKTFIAEIVSSVAWPLIVFLIIIQLKEQLAELLPRLKSFKHKDTELEFAEKLQELSIKDEANEENIPRIEKTPKIDKEYKFLIKLSEISPRYAVIESYRMLENAISKAIVKVDKNFESLTVRDRKKLEKVVLDKTLSEKQISQIEKLRNYEIKPLT